MLSKYPETWKNEVLWYIWDFVVLRRGWWITIYKIRYKWIKGGNDLFNLFLDTQTSNRVAIVSITFCGNDRLKDLVVEYNRARARSEVYSCCSISFQVKMTIIIINLYFLYHSLQLECIIIALTCKLHIFLSPKQIMDCFIFPGRFYNLLYIPQQKCVQTFPNKVFYLNKWSINLKPPLYFVQMCKFNNFLNKNYRVNFLDWLIHKISGYVTVFRMHFIIHYFLLIYNSELYRNS